MQESVSVENQYEQVPRDVKEEKIVKSKRVAYIDIARGIAIILMILGHVVGGYTRKIIFSFHMPLFVLVSGYFFKEDERVSIVIRKTIKSLIIPYIVTLITMNIIKGYMNGFTAIEILYTTIKQLIFSISFQKNINFKIQSVGPIWFIAFLVIIKFMFLGICKITKSNDIIKGIICYIISMVGILIGKKGYWLPFSIDVSLACIMFMYLGYIAKKFNILEKIISNWKIFILLSITWIISLKFGNIELAIRSYPNIITSYITAVIGTLVVIMISYCIEIKTKYLSKCLSWFGRNSMYILCIHTLENGLILYKGIAWQIKFALKMAIVVIGTIVINLMKKLLSILISKGVKYGKR